MASDDFHFRLKVALGDRSPAWLSTRAGIPDGTIRKYLAGSEPTIGNAAKIASALGVSLDWLSAMPASGAMKADYRLKGRRPPWWSDAKVRELVIAGHRQKTLDEVVAEIVALYGAERAPSRSSVGRVWMRIDRGHLVRSVGR